MKEIWIWLLNNYEMVIALSIIYGFFRSLKKSISKDVEMLATKMNKMEERIGKIEDQLKSIDQRLFRLEGAFEERGRWESRRTGTDRE